MSHKLIDTGIFVHDEVISPTPKKKKTNAKKLPDFHQVLHNRLKSIESIAKNSWLQMASTVTRIYSWRRAHPALKGISKIWRPPTQSLFGHMSKSFAMRLKKKILRAPH